MQRELFTGDELKAQALATLEMCRADVIKRARVAMVRILLAKGTATADDIRDQVALPDSVDPVCLGGVPMLLAKAGIIHRGGYRNSDRPDARRRPVSIWALTDRGKALQWLAENQ